MTTAQGIPNFEQRLNDLRAESQRFHAYLSALPAASWNAQSACDLWEVGHVVAHLVGVAEFYATTVERGIEGNVETLPGRAPAGSQTGATSHEGIHQRALAAREQLGEQVVTELAAQSDRLINVLANLKPDEHPKPCYHPGGYVPAGNFVDMRFKELGLHDWDIKSRLESDYHMLPASMPSMIILILNSFASGSLPYAFWPGPALDKPVRYRFNVTNPVELNADIVVESDRVHIQSPEGDPDVTCACDTETFLLMSYGRLPSSEAISTGRLTAQGDATAITRFSEWFRGI